MQTKIRIRNHIKVENRALPKEINGMSFFFLWEVLEKLNMGGATVYVLGVFVAGMGKLDSVFYG